MDPEQTEWREGIIAELVSNPRVEERAWHLATGMAEEGDPGISRQDAVASRPYLRACIMRMPEAEVSALSDEAAASLWARGALGAARYRAGRTTPSSMGPMRGRLPRQGRSARRMRCCFPIGKVSTSRGVGS